MHYVYILQSISNPNEYYTGLTSDIKNRIQTHNSGGVPHTSKFMPWKIIAYFALDSRDKAAKFEKYLKSGAGREFAKRFFR
ncbi:MAG: GIY-YIG nuclease family protein [Alphaproteobacteria bacterium]|nr:GIY-YIG nuclease family protein [Alphaproteobacteria bacterium]